MPSRRYFLPVTFAPLFGCYYEAWALILLLISSGFIAPLNAKEAVSGETDPLQVQLVLGETISSTSSKYGDTPAAVHVIITIPNYAENRRHQIQLDYRIECAAESFIPIELERGRGQLEHLHLSPPSSLHPGMDLGKESDNLDQPLTLIPNPMGRISFSVPITGILPYLTSKRDPFIPALFFRLVALNTKDLEQAPEYHDWTVAHMDIEILHKLSTLNARTLNRVIQQSAQSDTRPGHRQIHNAVTAIQNLCHHIKDRLGPSSRSSSRFVNGTKSFRKRSSPPSAIKVLNYDHQTNRIDTYRMSRIDQGAFPLLVHPLDVDADTMHLRKRSREDRSSSSSSHFLPSHIPAWKVNSTEYESFQNSSMRAVNKVKKWMLFHESRFSRFTSAVEAKIDRWIDIVADTISNSWVIITLILSGLGAALEYTLNSVKVFFNWDDILYANQFLEMYYRLLSPLAFKGVAVIQSQAHEFFANVSTSHRDLFADALKNLGAKNMSVGNLLSKGGELLKRSSNSSEPVPVASANETVLSIPKGGDARALFLQDRVINNLPHMKPADQEASSDLTAMVVKLIQLLKNVAAILLETLDKEEVEKIVPHILKFENLQETSYTAMTIATLLTYIQSILYASLDVISHVAEALISSMSAYWEITLILMETKWFIPFIPELWSQKLLSPLNNGIMRNTTGGISFLTVFNMIGTPLAVWQYKIANNDVAPFTALDIEVLSTCTEPELLLYTWNHDPRTNAMKNEDLQNLRLGIYSWIPDSQQTTLSALLSAYFDVTQYQSVIFGHASTGNPGQETFFPQVLGAICSMMGQIGVYPMTQLTSNEAGLVARSSANPDPRFLWWWAMWIIETMIKSARPMLGVGHWSNRAPYYGLVNFALENFPWVYFGIPVQIATGVLIAPTDEPRLFVQGIGWVKIVARLVYNVIPLLETAWGDNIPRAIKHNFLYIQLSLDTLFNALSLLSAEVCIQYQVVGMLSNSYQPDRTPT